MAEESEKNMPESLMANEENTNNGDVFVDDPEKQAADDAGLTARTTQDSDHNMGKSAAELLEEDIPWIERFMQVVKTYAPLGFVAFGGPQAHVAILRDHLVVQRKWLDEEQFTELFAIGQGLPGPTSTQLVVSTALARAGEAYYMWGVGLSCHMIYFLYVFSYFITFMYYEQVQLVVLLPSSCGIFLV